MDAVPALSAHDRDRDGETTERAVDVPVGWCEEPLSPATFTVAGADSTPTPEAGGSTVVIHAVSRAT